MSQPDTTPRWVFVAAFSVWLIGLAGWIVASALNGSVAVWPQVPILVVVGLALYGAVWSHRHPAG
jgi:hypothetical protein